MARKSRKQNTTVNPQEDARCWKAAVYIRLSVGDTKTGSGSIETQKLIIDRYLQQHPDILVIDTYIDNGCTGTNFNRPSFQRMLSDIEEGRINCVVVKDLSRLGRNSIDTGYYIEQYFRVKNVRFIAVNEQFDTADPESADQGILLPLRNMINEAYSLDIGRKIKAQQRQAMKDGKFVGGRAPYGYKKAEHDCHQLVIDPNTAPIVLQMFQWAAEGCGLNTIVLKLNEAGFITPSHYKKLCGEYTNDKQLGNGRWQTFTVAKILHSQIYTGDLAQGHTKTVDHKQVKTDEDLIVVEGTHEPIVSHELFDKVQTILDGKAAESKARTVKPYADNILKGKIFCGCCGKPLHWHRNTKKKTEDTYYYYCLSKTRVSKDACDGLMINEEAVMSVLTDTLLSSLDVVLGKYALHSPESKQQKTLRQEMSEKIESRTQEIGRLKQLSRNLYESFVEGIITKDEYRQFKERYDQQIQKLEPEVEQLKHGLAAMEAHRLKCESLARDAAAIRKNRGLTAELVERLIDKVVIDPSKEFHISLRFSSEYNEYMEVLNRCRNM